MVGGNKAKFEAIRGLRIDFWREGMDGGWERIIEGRREGMEY